MKICTMPIARCLLSSGSSSLEPYVKGLLRLSRELPNTIEYYGVIYAPKLVMAFIAAVGEYYTIELIQKLCLMSMNKSNDDKTSRQLAVKKFALILTVTNFFNSFIITRTFINSFEMVLTCAALFYWDWTGGKRIHGLDFTKSLAIGIFTCLQRPSNALIWITLGGFLVSRLLREHRYYTLVYLLFKLFVIFVGTVLFNCIIDYYFYHRLIFPIFRFLKFNFTSPLSEFYGVSAWHFHITQSVPIMLGLSLPLFLYGFCAPLSRRKFASILVNPLLQMKVVILVVIIAFSYLPHKEFRFIYPLQPFFTSVAAFGLLKISETFQFRSKILKELLWSLPLLSIFAALFLNTFNEAGVISVMGFLHQVPTPESVGFIMPCHSTPWQSYLHRNDIRNLWAITCDPPLHLLDDPKAYEKLPYYMDESDYLYEDTPGFLHQNFPPLRFMEQERHDKVYSHQWPEYLVIFEHLEHEYVGVLLKNSSYVEVFRSFNSFAHWDSRRQGDVLVYRKMIGN